MSWKRGRDWKELETTKGSSGYGMEGTSLLAGRLPPCHPNHADPAGLSRCSWCGEGGRKDEETESPDLQLSGFRASQMGTDREIKSKLWRSIQGCHVFCSFEVGSVKDTI